MPKSRRSSVVPLTATTSKGRLGKESLVEEIREALNNYTYVYVFEVHNSRNNLIKEVRAGWESSQFIFGKNKVMQLALGRDAQDEQRPNIHQLSEKLTGLCGLFFTNEPKDKILNYFRTYRVADYPRSGYLVGQTVELEEGPLPQFAHSLEPYLRSIGLPTELRNGVIHLRTPHVVCREGDTINPDQAKILKLLDMKLSEFFFEFIGVWSNDSYEDLVQQDADMSN